MPTRFAFLALALLVTVATLMHSPPVSADAVKTCQKHKDRIERYNRLRRRGGDAALMEEWKRERRKSENEFSRLKCRKYKRQLT